MCQDNKGMCEVPVLEASDGELGTAASGKARTLHRTNAHQSPPAPARVSKGHRFLVDVGWCAENNLII